MLNPPSRGIITFDLFREIYSEDIILKLEESSYILNIKTIKPWFNQMLLPKDVQNKILDVLWNCHKIRYNSIYKTFVTNF